jgi:hypothetical protein
LRHAQAQATTPELQRQRAAMLPFGESWTVGHLSVEEMHALLLDLLNSIQSSHYSSFIAFANR